MPAVTVMFATYNEPRWLEWVLWGYTTQTSKDFEVIVVDDGSREDTREVIDRLRPQMNYPLRHFWQADEGYQKCKGMNRGILLARSDYLIFTDGDCIPHPQFVARHLALRERGRYLTGGYCKLPLALSQAITREDILAGRATDYAWLAANGLERHTLKLRLQNETLRSLFNTLTPVKPRLHGHNASVWKDDVIRVNGWDERMQYGGQDLELGERLVNAGVRGKTIRYSAICVHLEHKRGYMKPEMREKNDAIRAQTRRERASWTPYGIDLHKDEDNRVE
ncbi:MAG: glycosyltransferase family 2 protein [Dokdonella sp.]|uniref:glycosyltransferase family 2 protein n=1 Tax=Dokdonella sp. TaxID=2291710 RepID=UPI0025C689ED|nr:glycosyltransferase family 2 protein [Dokdonella sp.]MBZ0222260.1 glycosyltransferase family 2 protein [Dokdonella sp.]MCC7255709.1 glycosyltransferase family 2 protein [Dokdonella sp.]